MFNHFSSTAATGKEDRDEIIEINSAPNILFNDELPQPNVVSKLSLSSEVSSSWDLKPNDSFLQIEKMVSDLCVNTNDIIEQFSKKTHNDQEAIQSLPHYEMEIQNIPQTEEVQFVENLTHKIERPHKPVDATNLLSSEANAANTEFITPTKQKTTLKVYTTPLQERFHSPTFKTPVIPVSLKKFQTPSKKRSFQHVVSPVATYINNPPVVLHKKNVNPKKSLIGYSGIPKPINSALKHNLNNKENHKVPSFAYRAPKESKMVGINLNNLSYTIFSYNIYLIIEEQLSLCLHHTVFKLIIIVLI